MEGHASSLKTASSYLNHLLLSRGLLRSGNSINFAKPHKAEGGTEATMSQVINLVHDLVLRRDREAGQREHLGETLRDLHASETKQKMDIERVRNQKIESDRLLSVAQGQERTHKATMRSLETSMRDLREEMLRHKTMMQQIRTQCANDVRKRDVQIERLKSHLTTQQRGSRQPLTSSTLTIIPTPALHHTSVVKEGSAVSLDSPDYSLTQETTEFLTQLSQSLSDENDNLVGLLRASLTTLRSLQGLKAQPNHPSGQDHESMKSVDHTSAPADPDLQLAQNMAFSYDALAGEMNEVLGHLRLILTSPSFVPVEELEIREDEIIRLREGWEKMETRWREAVALMDGWRKRMLRGGGSVNLEEIKMGLMLSPIKLPDEVAIIPDGPSCLDTSGLCADEDAAHEEILYRQGFGIEVDAEENPNSKCASGDEGDDCSDLRHTAEERALQEVQPNATWKPAMPPTASSQKRAMKRRNVSKAAKVDSDIPSPKMKRITPKEDDPEEKDLTKRVSKRPRTGLKVHLRGDSTEPSKIPRRGTPARRNSALRRKRRESLNVAEGMA